MHQQVIFCLNLNKHMAKEIGFIQDPVDGHIGCTQKYAFFLPIESTSEVLNGVTCYFTFSYKSSISNIPFLESEDLILKFVKTVKYLSLPSLLSFLYPPYLILLPY